MCFRFRLLLTMLLASPGALLLAQAASAQVQPSPAPATDDQQPASGNAANEAGQERTGVTDSDAGNADGDSAAPPEQQDEAATSPSAEVDSVQSDLAADRRAMRRGYIERMENRIRDLGFAETPETIAAGDSLESCLSEGGSQIPIMSNQPWWQLAYNIVAHCRPQVDAFEQAWQPQMPRGANYNTDVTQANAQFRVTRAFGDAVGNLVNNVANKLMLDRN